MRIGFAGLGRMGRPMARNLAAAGYELLVWNRSEGPAEMLAHETGCGVARSPADLSEASDIVVTMLADDAASEAVHLGPSGLFAAAGPRAVVEMGTVSPDHIAALVAAAPDGMCIVDAPVSGATQAAADAQLLVMAGCSEETARDLDLPFEALGRRTHFLGAAGRGASMKLAVNAMLHGLNQTLAEALVLAEASGIGTEAAFDVIAGSAAGAPMLGYRRQLYLDEAAHEVSFTVSLAAKDMMLAAALAERLGTPMPQGAVTLDVLCRAELAGFGERDMASVVSFNRGETR